MDHTAALVSLATAVPPHQFHQQRILEAARGLMADRYPEFETLASLFANTGIRHRYGVRPMEWYLERRGWPDRTQAFLEGAEALFIDGAEKALARAGLAADDIDTWSRFALRVSRRRRWRRASPAGWDFAAMSRVCRCSVSVARAVCPACRSRPVSRNRGPAAMC
jgi:hypothetical protein